MPNRFEIGDQWRLIEGEYPNEGSPRCLQIQHRQGTEWTTKATFYPEGEYRDAGKTAWTANSTTAQSMPQNAWTTINYENTDGSSEFTTGSNWQFKPARKGRYFISATVSLNPSSYVNGLLISITLNGSVFVAAVCLPLVNTGFGRQAIHCCADVTLNGTTDFVQCQLWQSTGGNQPRGTDPSENRFMAHRIEGFVE